MLSTVMVRGLTCYCFASKRSSQVVSSPCRRNTLAPDYVVCRMVDRRGAVRAFTGLRDRRRPGGNIGIPESRGLQACSPAEPSSSPAGCCWSGAQRGTCTSAASDLSSHVSHQLKGTTLTTLVVIVTRPATASVPRTTRCNQRQRASLSEFVCGFGARPLTWQ